MQQDTPPAQVGKLVLQGVDVCFAQGQLQLHAVGGEVFLQYQPAEFGDPQLDQVQFGKPAVAAQRHAADQLDALGGLQAFVRAAAIRPRQPAGAQLDAAVPANHQHHHLIEALGLDGGEDRSPGGAARFAVVVAAVLVGEFPGPAIVRGVQVAVLLDERLGFLRTGDRCGQGNEAAFANFFAEFAKAGEGERHRRCRLEGGLDATAFENDVDQVGAGVFHILFGQLGAPGDAADLAGEVGIVLGAAPQQEDQVDGVDGVHLAGIDPGLEHGRPAAEPGAVVLAEVFGKAFAAADDLHGEDPRGLGLSSGKLHLGADVAGEGYGRVVLGGQRVEGAVPQFEDIAEHRDVQAHLVGEVVVQVGLRQPGAGSDGVHAGALVAVTRELVFGRLKNRLLVLLPNAAGGLPGVGAVGRNFEAHGGFRADR